MGRQLGRSSLRPLVLWGVPVALALAAFVIAFFQPHKLFIDQRVDEKAPAGPASAPAGRLAAGGDGSPEAPALTAPEATPEPVTVASGAFRSLEHSTTGRAVVTELPDRSRILRFEDLATSNGPDLRVYLSAGSNDAGFGAEYGRDFVELGRLKGNIGNQNYQIPPGTDLERYRNAVIWCARFRVGFGVATLGG